MLDVLRSVEVMNVLKTENRKALSDSGFVGKTKSKRKYVFMVALMTAFIASGICAYTVGFFDFGKPADKISLFPAIVNEKASYFDSPGKDEIATQFYRGLIIL